jgi:hypothetical protein
MAAAAPKHQGNNLPAQFGGSQVVDFGDVAKRFVGRIGEPTGGPRARIVHQDIHRPSFLNPLDQIRDLCRVRKVRRVRGATEPGRQSLYCAACACHQRHRGTGVRELVS